MKQAPAFPTVLRSVSVILLLLAITACGGTHGDAKDKLRAHQGFLDLSAYDLAKQGPIELNGSWEFYWMKILKPDDFTTSARLQPEFFTVPGMWGGQQAGSVTLTTMGHATYRLRIRLANTSEPLAVMIPTLGSAFALYADNTLVAAAGTVGTSDGTSVGAYRPGIYTFIPQGTEIELVLQISNYQQKWGGPWYALHFGRAKDLQRSWDIDLARDLFVFGAIFIMFMYHVAIFILRRKDLSSLFFGLFCLVITVRGTVQSSAMFTFLLPSISLEWLLTIDYLTFYTGIPLFCLFMHSLFEREFNRTVLAATLVLSSLFCVLVLVTPPRIFEYSLEPYQLIAVILALYGIYVAVAAVVRKREGAVVMLVGYACVAIPMVNDVLYAQSIIRTGYLVTYGLFLFIFIQAYLLARRFSSAFSAVEKLSGELEGANAQLADLNRTLEQKVMARTEELQATMEELTAVNEELTRTRDHLWGEMQLAKKIQTVLLPERPSIPGYQISTYMAPAEEVGGDYYDIINVEGIDWLVIGDVSGHGVPAGLFMMMVQTAIHTALAGTPNLKPNALLSRVNRVITENMRKLGEDKYMTITVIACLKDRGFYFSGLHQDIMVYRVASGTVEDVETRGFWIGLVDDIKGLLHDDEILLNPGDCMLLYTDGITEAWRRGSVRDQRDPASDMFGHQRLKSCLEGSGSQSPEQIREAILEALTDYQPDDDITMVILKKV